MSDRKLTIMRDGPNGDGKPWQAYQEAAPGLTIGTTDHTEPLCRVSGYLRKVEAEANLIIESVNEQEALRAKLKLAQDALRKAPALIRVRVPNEYRNWYDGPRARALEERCTALPM